MHAPIRHRGPDGEGVLLFDAGRVRFFDDASRVPADAAASVAFAFRRLKIMDLTAAAAQPMSSRDGSRWIVFNGEIYNFRGLREELAARGHTFNTTGDTEVILAAYEEWGTECFRRFEGMWAIVILDLRENRLIACRDRFGIKPLYCWSNQERLLLSSEIRQILNVVGKPRANPTMLRSFLTGDRDTFLDDTFFEGVASVPPGSWLEVSLDHNVRFQTRRYWTLDDFQERTSRIDYATALETVGRLMTEAVCTHSLSDVPLGSLLSGGLDSSTIAAILVRRQPGAPTFSFGFREAAPRYCELPFVDAIVRAEGMRNYETTFSAEWIIKNAAAVVTSLEEPPLAMPSFAQYRIFELCRQHGTTVVLDGQGSDEIFAGYPYHERILLLDHLRHGRISLFVREARAIATRDSTSLRDLVTRAFIRPVVSEATRKVSRRNDWILRDYGNNTPPDRSTTVNERLHHDVSRGNAKIILGYADKNSMRFSIEARVPYFDRRLVEFAFTLPAEFKIGEGTRKRVLRDFARTMLPRQVTERRDRMGFATPDAEWLRGPLWSTVREAVSDPSLRTTACFDSARLQKFVEKFDRGGKRDYRGMWRVWMLSVWREVFSVAI